MNDDEWRKGRNGERSAINKIGRTPRDGGVCEEEKDAN
jgi:hypothetical protein